VLMIVWLQNSSSTKNEGYARLREACEAESLENFGAFWCIIEHTKISISRDTIKKSERP
jgi:hypothetical protein